MEVSVEYNIPKDEWKECVIHDVKCLSMSENGKRKSLHVIDCADEGIFFGDVYCVKVY